MATAARALARRFRGDESGNFLMIASLALPVLVGFAGFGSDAALWLYKHRAMQSGADSAAISAATAYIHDVKSDSSLQTQAQSTAGSYGFVNGSNDVTVGVSVTTDEPSDSTSPATIAVTITQPQKPLFMGHVLGDVTIETRAVARGTPRVRSTGCVLALDTSASGAVSMQGNPNVVLTGCSLGVNSSSKSALSLKGSADLTALSVGVVGGISGQNRISAGTIASGVAATKDPYSDVPSPVYSGGRWSLGDSTAASSCDQTNFAPSGTVTIGPSDPNGIYVLCGGMTLNGGVTVYLRPGIYILDQGTLSINGGGTLCNANSDGSLKDCNHPIAGVTLIFTSHTGSNSATASVNGNAVLKLTAPSSGPTLGIAIYGDRSMKVGTVLQFNGGASQIIDGAVYAPEAAVSFSGGSATSNACTHLVADTISFGGNASFKIGCPNERNTDATPASVRLIQ